MFNALVDSFLGPVQTILQSTISRLDQVSLVAARGLNMDYYHGPIMYMGAGWKALIGSVVASAFLLLIVLVSRKGYGLYLSLKEGVKWW
ncbi:hypothetical protein [Desulfitobacterium hafniense]|uniref:hypothetical protein n=1 Tax=Desulfitobacterium hafniense TaxID=49338 RepID=UPI0003827BF2|nr:hypothetical protein [Desulfitobacterium hafniense]